MDKLEELTSLRGWLHSKYRVSLETFDDRLQLHYDITLKQMVANWQANPYLPLINYVITEGIEDQCL